MTYLKSQLSNLVLLGHPDVLKYFLGEQVTRFPVEEMCLAKSLQDPWDDSVADPKAGNSIWIWGLDAA
ncbi:MAG: hypothetical protein HYX41_04485 [Bdellovibrio sp.]|nr:hypothetical protein [Bdellovibrio sp.]